MYIRTMPKQNLYSLIAIALSACGDAKKTTNNEGLIDYTVEQNLIKMKDFQVIK